MLEGYNEAQLKILLNKSLYYLQMFKRGKRFLNLTKHEQKDVVDQINLLQRIH